jgi:uncharacterized coiled-coil protein SlyX
MTYEEMQRTMEFIIQRQEAFAENMTKAEERMSKDETKINRLESAFVNIFNIVSETTKNLNSLTERMDKLAHDHDGRIAETDERLNTLIDVVERYISERRNGGN